MLEDIEYRNYIIKLSSEPEEKLREIADSYKNAGWLRKILWSMSSEKRLMAKAADYLLTEGKKRSHGELEGKVITGELKIVQF